MFHGETYKTIRNLKIHEVLFYVFLLFLPLQTRILYNPTSAYIQDYFNYHLAFFVYLTDLILITCFISWFLFPTNASASEAKQSILSFRLLRRSNGLLANANNRFFWLILAFFLVILIGMFPVKHLDFGLYQAFKWLELWLLVIYIWQTFHKRFHFIVSCATIFVSGLGQAFLGLWQFHVQHGLGLGWLGEYIAPIGTSGLATINVAGEKLIRAYGTMPHPNVFGAFLVFGLFMGFFLVSHGTSKETHPRESGDLNKALSRSPITYLILASGMVIVTLGIFVSFSRLAWIAAAIGFFGFGLYYLLKKAWKPLILLGFIAIVSGGTILFFFGNDFSARVFDANQTALVDRWFFDDLGLKMMAQHPLLGVGVGNYVPALQAGVSLASWQYQPAHNIFIFLGAELGIIGLIIFLGLVWEICRRLKNIFSDPLLFTIYSLLITILLMGQFDHYFVTIQQGRLMFFTILGLLAALPNLYDQRRVIPDHDPESRSLDSESSSE
ncbi:MAG: hypothetical protein A3B10_03060 [Candidatus Doudnabacteria bacterium RIFCSPLOWO2_01_FULL_44_21]|uniref:O-antigen ligase-related domain-containing protein n=1 Tax=Candidatus Doudnabacteria bacterium RIFCSPLOWO2_01_FULL_44_21 TaxID=1817841 RepID=A0A1F5Q2U0_9BACT|nr:MAG: hypothetical protein A3B95_03325 [Candidatus Doudnabacteria bacterium RIFCSPHIGHO2_02_FULL_43_13b]OGE96262.1 MAG: hypothetical protein A3B10_03060 [Candidatus Doudnabacteria bacterium RIFCSPLOWO2_01_FULL_44_21]